jgi:penicillin-binding protein 2
VSIIFFIFIVRLFTLQIIQYPEWLSAAEENRRAEISIPTLRGVIYDRNGIVLARNIASYNVAITPAYLPDDDGEIEDIINKLSYLTGMPINKGDLSQPLIDCGENLGITQMVAIGDSFSPYQPVLIECDIDQELAMVIKEEAVDWPGVSIEIEPIRDYPTGETTAGIIGFLGPIWAEKEEEFRELGFIPRRDKVGYAGVELYFQESLSGRNGKRVVEADVAGQVLRDVEAPIPPESGLNLVLTIDTRLQQAAFSILLGEINDWNAYFNEIRITSGVVIAMNPQTGEILAMVSYPTYENNRLARFIPAYYNEQLLADATQPLLNHAVGAELPAGSVFKLVTAVGALNERVVAPDQIIDTPAKIVIEERYYANQPGTGRELVDWNPEGFGQLDFIGGIANSSNVYFYKLGGGYKDEVNPGLGICRLGTYARAIGYGQILGIELPDEVDGHIPDPTWKRIFQGENWSSGDTYIASVGQGFVLSSPLQVLMSAATVANDGKVVRPTLLREIIDGEGNIVTPFQVDVLWDLTTEARIEQYENPEGIGSCKVITDERGEPVLTTVEPWVFDKVQEGMRRAVTHGTLEREFEFVTVTAAGKTGTAEYCDRVALEKGLCIPGNWPTHAWTTAYAPFDDPEIAVVAFLYNGGEGASVAGPVVRKLLEAYFELKAIDTAVGNP